MQMFPEIYSGPFNCLTQTAKKYGVSKLYSGLGPALFADLSEKSGNYFTNKFYFVLVKIINTQKFSLYIFKSVLFCAYGYIFF